MGTASDSAAGADRSNLMIGKLMIVINKEWTSWLVISRDSHFQDRATRFWISEKGSGRVEYGMCVIRHNSINNVSQNLLCTDDWTTSLQSRHDTNQKQSQNTRKGWCHLKKRPVLSSATSKPLNWIFFWPYLALSVFTTCMYNNLVLNFIFMELSYSRPRGDKPISNHNLWTFW